MENHSGLSIQEVQQRSFFELFPEVSEDWFRRKVERVLMLETPMFTVWEQRPFVVRFKNYQPVTGQEEYMFQNTTLLPLTSINGQIEYVALLIYDVTQIAVSHTHLLLANQKLEQLSRIDRLTGLNNRGHWEDELKREFARHQRYSTKLSLLMFDIDHFKKINDTYGHRVGDHVIQCLAQQVKDCIRNTDIAGRYGGEEFVVLLPNVDSAGASLLAERLCKRVAALEIMHNAQPITFTISLGVADVEGLSSHEQLTEHADQALYESKRRGRGCVTVYGS